MTALRWLAVLWAVLVTLMLVASLVANFVVAGSFGEGLMRLTQLYAGLSLIGYDEEAEAGLPSGNALVILLLYAPSFVLYLCHERLRRKAGGDVG